MADGGATFVFDTNIEDVVSRIVTGLQQVQRTVNNEGGAGTSRLTSNLPRDIGVIVDDAQRQINKLNQALSAGTLKGSLTKGYQGVVTDLNKAIGQITAGRGLTLDVGLKFATGPIKELIKSLQTQLVAAANSTNKVIAAKAGSGVLQNRRIDFDAGAKAGDEANKIYAQQVKKRADQVARSARFAQLTAAEDAKSVVAAKAVAKNRGREATATTKTANTAEVEVERVVRAARDSQQIREQLAAEQEKALRLAREANAAVAKTTSTTTGTTGTAKRATIPAQTTTSTASARSNSSSDISASSRTQSVGDAAKIQAFNQAIAKANTQFERGIFGPGQLETQLNTIRDRFNQIAQNVSVDTALTPAQIQAASSTNRSTLAGAIVGDDGRPRRSGTTLTREDLLDLLSVPRQQRRGATTRQEATLAAAAAVRANPTRRPPDDDGGGSGGKPVKPRNPTPPTPAPAAAAATPSSIPSPRLTRDNATRIAEVVASTALGRSVGRQFQAQSPTVLAPAPAPRPSSPAAATETTSTLLPLDTPVSSAQRYQALLRQVGGLQGAPGGPTPVLDTLLGRTGATGGSGLGALGRLLGGNQGPASLRNLTGPATVLPQRSALEKVGDYLRRITDDNDRGSALGGLSDGTIDAFSRLRRAVGPTRRILPDPDLSQGTRFEPAFLLPHEIPIAPVAPVEKLTPRENHVLHLTQDAVYDGTLDELPPEVQALKERARKYAAYEAELRTYRYKTRDLQASVRRRVAAEPGRVSDRPDFRVEDPTEDGRFPEHADERFPNYTALIGPRNNPLELGSITTMNQGPLRAIRMLHVFDEFHRQGVAREMYNFGRLSSQQQLGRMNPNADPLFNDLYHSDNLTSMGRPFALSVGGPVAYMNGGIGDATPEGIIRRDPETLPESLRGYNDYYEDEDTEYKEKLKREKEKKLKLKEKEERKIEDAQGRANLFDRAILLRDRPPQYADPDYVARLGSLQVASGELQDREDAVARVSNVFGRAHLLRGTTPGQTALPLVRHSVPFGGIHLDERFLAADRASTVLPLERPHGDDRGSIPLGPANGRFLGIPTQRNRSTANAAEVRGAADASFERAERLKRIQDAFDAIPFQEQSTDRRVAPPITPFSPFARQRRRNHAAFRDGIQAPIGEHRAGDRVAFIPIPRRNDPDFDTHDAHPGDNILPATSPGRFAPLDRFLQAVERLRQRLPKPGDDRGSIPLGPTNGSFLGIPLGGAEQREARVRAAAEQLARTAPADDRAAVAFETAHPTVSSAQPPRVVTQRVPGATSITGPEPDPEQVAADAEAARLARNERQRNYRAARKAAAAAAAAGGGGAQPPTPPTGGGGGGGGGDDGGETPEEERARLEAEAAAAAAAAPKPKPKKAAASGGGRGGGKGGPPPKPPTSGGPDDDDDQTFDNQREETPEEKEASKARNTKYRKQFDFLTGGEQKFETLSQDVLRLSDKYVADFRKFVEDGSPIEISRKTRTGFNLLEDRATPEFQGQLEKARAKKAALDAQAARQAEKDEADRVETERVRVANKNLRTLTKGAADEGEFSPGVDRIGTTNAFVADTRGKQTRIFKQTADGFEEIEKGTAQFKALTRRLRNQTADAGKGGIFDSFIRGATSGSAFGGGGKGGTPTLSAAFDGLARSAGTTAKYATLGTLFYQIQNAALAAGGEVLDFADSFTDLNIALSDPSKEVQTTTTTINRLSDAATLAGTNVGESMDQAASAIRAFRGETDGSQGALESLGVSFATQASRIKTITGGDLKDVSDNLKATSLAFGADFSEVTDTIAGAKRVGGGNENDIQAGIAAAAVAAKEAGFSLEETGVLISRIVAETSESGLLAATRFSKISAILGGSAGKAALQNLNLSLNPKQKIDTTASIATQIKQLSAVYNTPGAIGEGPRQQLINSLGGTANTKELIVLLSSANDLTKAASQGFDGEGLEEYKKRLEDLRATLTRITGELKNITVAIANSGVLDPIVVAVQKGLLPALDITRKLLNTFNLIPRPLRSAGFFLGEMLVVLKLIKAITNAGGIGGFARGVEEKVAPTAALSRKKLAATEAKKAKKAAKSSLITDAAINTVGLGRDDQPLTKKQQKRADEARAATEAAERRRSVTGLRFGSDAAAPIKRGYARLTTDYTKFLFGLSEASQFVGDRQIQKLGSDLTPENRRVLDAVGRANGDDGLTSRTARANGVSLPQRFRNSADRGNFEFANLIGSFGFGEFAPTPADIAAREAAGQKVPAGSKLKSKISKGIDAIGPEAAIFGTVAALAGLLEASKKIFDGVQQAEALSLKASPDSLSILDLGTSSAKLRAGAHAANEASSGFFGSIVNFGQGNVTGTAAKALKEQGDLQASVKDRLQFVQENARSAAATDRQALANSIDLSSADGLTTSIEGLDKAGRSATVQFRALLDALDNFANKSTATATNLSDIDQSTAAGGTAIDFQNQFIQGQKDAAFAASETGQRKGSFLGKALDIGDTAGTFGLNPFLRSRDNSVGRFFRKHGTINPVGLFTGDYLTNGGQAAQKAFDEGSVDSNDLAGGLQTITEKFLRQKGDVTSFNGEKQLRKLYEDFFKLHAPNATQAEIDDQVEIAYQIARKNVKALTSVKDPKATLSEILAQGKALAQKSAAEAGTDAALGKGTQGQALAESSTYLKGLQEARAAAFKAGAKPEQLEQFDFDIKNATIANIPNISARKDVANALAQSTVSQDSTAEAIQNRIDQANRKLSDGGVDPKTGKRKTRTVVKKINTETYDPLKGRVVPEVRTSRTTEDVPGIDDPAVEALLTERNLAEQEKLKQRVRDRVAARRAGIDSRDEVKNAAADTQDAQDELSRLRANGTTGEALDTAALNLAKAQRAEAVTRTEAAIAARNVNAIPASSIDTATRALRDGQDKLKDLKRGTIAYNQQLAANVQAENEVAIAQNNVKSIGRQLAIDLTNPVQVANEAVQTAKDEQARIIKQTAGNKVKPNVRKQLRGDAEIAVRNAQANAESAQFSQFLSNAQTADNLGRISHKAYIALLQNRADRLSAEIALLGPNDPLKQLKKDERDQLLGLIKSTADALSGVFNIGDIKVPTPYEVRKAIASRDSGTILAANSAASTAGNVVNDNSTKNVVLNGLPIEKVIVMFEQLFGLKVRTKTGKKGV